jgi:hypothetical protein
MRGLLFRRGRRTGFRAFPAAPIAFRAVFIAAFAASLSSTDGDFAVIDGRSGAPAADLVN